MVRKSVAVMVAILCVLGPTARAGAVDLAPGTRIRLMTGVPPWTESQGTRVIPGQVVREDEESLTFLPKGGGEPVTRTKPGHWLEGYWVSSDEGTLVLKRSKNGGILRIPADVVSRLEVSKGASRAKSALLGAGAGAMALALLASTADSCHGARSTPPEFDLGGCLFSRGDLAALGAVEGAILGGLIGFGFGREKWGLVDEPRVGLSVGPLRGGGVGARLALRF